MNNMSVTKCVEQLQCDTYACMKLTGSELRTAYSEALVYCTM